MVSLSSGIYARGFDSSLSSFAYEGINRGAAPVFEQTTRNVFPYLTKTTQNNPVSDFLLASASYAIPLMTLGGLYAIYSTLKRGFKDGKIMKKMKPFKIPRQFKMPKEFKDFEEFVLPNGYQFPVKYPYLTEQEKKNSQSKVNITRPKQRRSSEKYYYDDSDFDEIKDNSISTSNLDKPLSNSRDLSLLVEPRRYNSKDEERTSNSHYTEENNSREDERARSHYSSNRSSGNSSYTRRQTNGMSIDDAFSMFGVDKNASFEEAKKAYRKFMLKNHPNFNQGDIDKVELTKKLNKAWEMIQKYHNRKV